MKWIYKHDQWTIRKLRFQYLASLLSHYCVNDFWNFFYLKIKRIYFFQMRFSFSAIYFQLCWPIYENFCLCSENFMVCIKLHNLERWWKKDQNFQTKKWCVLRVRLTFNVRQEIKQNFHHIVKTISLDKFSYKNLT